MRSRRRKGRRNRDGLWICGIAVLAAGAVFTARTEILDLVTTEIAFVLDPKQEGGEKESDQDIAERVESTDGGKETLTDGGVDLAETDEAGADPDQKNTDAGTEASGSGNSDPEAAELPSSYDIRDHRTVTVSDQGDLGTCWAFAALKAVETSMPGSMAVPLSADHMSIHNSFGISQNSGGDYSMAMAYLLAWQGPVSEEDDPYGDSTSADGLAPVCHVQEIRILPERNYDAVKRAVYLYGGVQTSLYLPSENRVSDEDVCYKGSEEPNHDAVIIGWDDNYPRSNFNTPLEGDGAFICQNSWGDGFGENGIFYVSYYDTNIGTHNVAYTRVDDVHNYDHIYQSDLCGWVGKLVDKTIGSA